MRSMSNHPKSRVGRPTFTDERAVQMNLRLSESDLEWLTAESQRQGGSGRNAVVRRLIAEARQKQETA